MDWDTHTKNVIRNLVCKKPENTYNSILLLPSGTCYDLKELLQNGAISVETRVVAIERDKLLASVIKQKLQEMGFMNFEVHQKDLHEVDLTQERFDFVYLDTCGQLTVQILTWLIEHVQSKAFKGVETINFAFSSSFRHQNLLKLFEKHCKKTKIRLAKTKETLMGIKEDAKFQRKEHLLTATLLALVFGTPSESFIYKNSSHGVPMHVFTFRPRKLNNGITTVIKFLTTLGVEPKVTGAGVKAALKRKGGGIRSSVRHTPKSNEVEKKIGRPKKLIGDVIWCSGEKEYPMRADDEALMESFKELRSFLGVSKKHGVSDHTVKNRIGKWVEANYTLVRNGSTTKWHPKSIEFRETPLKGRVEIKKDSLEQIRKDLDNILKRLEVIDG